MLATGVIHSRYQSVALRIDIGCNSVCYLTGVAARCDSAIKGRRTEPDHRFGSARKHPPQAGVLSAIGARAFLLFESHVFAPAIEEERTVGRSVIRPIKRHAAAI
jgi:hypothetical protein